MPMPKSLPSRISSLSAIVFNHTTRSGRRFRRDEALDPALEAQGGGEAPEQRVEGALVLDSLVDLHVGRRVVAPAHPPAADAELLLDEREQGAHLGAHVGDGLGWNPVVDVVVQTGITASASPTALST